MTLLTFMFYRSHPCLNYDIYVLPTDTFGLTGLNDNVYVLPTAGLEDLKNDIYVLPTVSQGIQGPHL